MILRYRNHTLVAKPGDARDEPACIVFEGDSDEVLGEYGSAREAKAELDRRASERDCRRHGE